MPVSRHLRRSTQRCLGRICARSVHQQSASRPSGQVSMPRRQQSSVQSPSVTPAVGSSASETEPMDNAWCTTLNESSGEQSVETLRRISDRRTSFLLSLRFLSGHRCSVPPLSAAFGIRSKGCSFSSCAKAG